MDSRYTTLQTLSRIAKEQPNHIQYLTNPRELILHSTFDWDLIHSHLTTLEKEGFVKITQADTLLFSITIAGMEMLSTLSSEPEAEIKISLRSLDITNENTLL